jgi:hypothetical protein
VSGKRLEISLEYMQLKVWGDQEEARNHIEGVGVSEGKGKKEDWAAIAKSEQDQEITFESTKDFY